MKDVLNPTTDGVDDTLAGIPRPFELAFPLREWLLAKEGAGGGGHGWAVVGVRSRDLLLHRCRQRKGLGWLARNEEEEADDRGSKETSERHDGGGKGVWIVDNSQQEVATGELSHNSKK